MNRSNKLILVTGTGRSLDLGREVYGILKENYKLGSQVELIESIPASALSPEQKDVKDRTRPLEIDRFDDGEVFVEMGKDILLRRLRDNHVAFVKYLFDPDNGGIHVNRHLFEVFSFFKVLNDHLKKRGDVEKLTLADPYLTYLRMHRADEYIENNDFYQANTLELMIDIFHMVGIDEVLTIDPHAKEVEEYCKKVGVKFFSHNPFSSSRYINWRKLGFESKDKAVDTLKFLQTFISYYEDHKGEYKNAVVVAPDKNSEDRSEYFAVDTRLEFNNTLYIDKGRLGPGKIIIKGIKDFSGIKPEEVKGRICVIPDDMISSGGTANDIGGYLKGLGAERVELWVTHAVSPKMEKIEKMEHIDKIVSLDTIVRTHQKFIQIPAAAQIMSAQIYKSYQRGTG